MMLSLDCETTGLDLRHGCKPFLVTICDEEGNNTWWEWDVDPLTREPKIDLDDIVEIQNHINEADSIVLHNPKFDVLALETAFDKAAYDEGIGYELTWDWSKTYDTLLAAHLLCSNHPHDLTSQAMIYLNLDVVPQDKASRAAADEARRLARKDYPDWRIAKAGDPQLPSAKATVWKNDLWLPKAIAKEAEYESDHPWWTVTSEYANSDSAVTMFLFKEQRKLLKKQGLWKLYKERLKIPQVVHAMESVGVSLNKDRLDRVTIEYANESDRLERKCISIASEYSVELHVPKSGSNNSLRECVFDHMKLPVVKRSEKTGEPSMDKATLDHWEATLPKRSPKLNFITSLKGKRKRDTALSYMEGYTRFWQPVSGDDYVLHPSLNPTGTHTLRWSSSNPNEQNISKQEGFNLRYCFGPSEGREWWALDYDNLELRIPAYECQEPAMLELFEHPDQPPYYGSYHLLVLDIVYPDAFTKYGRKVTEHRPDLYKKIKFGNFADMYGAGSATADTSFGVRGAQKKVSRRLPEKAKLNKKWIQYANKHGYVETIPDRTVDSRRGYPLYCRRMDNGRVSPTVPFNYHVQGTACWIMTRAMIKVQDYLNQLNRKAIAKGKPEYHMVMQVHDEMVLDFPYKPNKGNLKKVERIRNLMSSIGNDLMPAVNLTCGLDYHPNNWSESE
jgi:DNA polymerase I-like protein with 3'-5' exonuclease and polymerase domains